MVAIVDSFGATQLDTVLGSTNKVERLLSLIPRRKVGIHDRGCFYAIALVSPTGEKFVLSIQGAPFNYSAPREYLPRITNYDALEVAMWKGDLEVERNWVQPSVFGFTRIKDNPCDDVIGWVKLSDIVEDLVDMFARGWLIDGDDKDTREWSLKLLNS